MSGFYMGRLRVSAISFLNTAPLMWDFDHGDLRREFEVSYTLPSTCADSLRRGEADIGIIPVIAYASIPGLSVVPDVAIAADGPVRSILLVSKKPIEEIKTVAADTSSRTSVALTRIILRKWYGGGRTFTSMAPKLGDMLDECDAALLIGDPALSVNRKQYRVYDIAEEWKGRTGKAFVFAFWAVRTAVADPRLAPIFQHSRDHGLHPENLKWIAREWAPRVRLSEDDVISYLTRNIHFHLDAPKIEGLKLFFEYAVEVGIVAAVPPLQFIENEAPARAV